MDGAGAETAGRRVWPSGYYGHAACALFVVVFAVLWAVNGGWIDGRRGALALCLLPAIAVSAVLLDLADTVGEVRIRIRRRRTPAARRFEGPRIAGIVVGKVLCWAAVAAILAVGMPGIWRSVTGATNEMPALSVQRNGRELFLEGDIGRGFAERLDAALAQNPGIRSVTLESAGGLAAEGIAARAVLAARGIDTYVETRCHSACIDVFLGGRRREALAGADFGFHHPGIEIADTRVDASRGVPDGFLSGLPDAFRQRVLATPFSAEWHPDGPELLAAGVVTAYTDGAAHGLVARRDWMSPEGAYGAFVRPAMLAPPVPGEAAAVQGLVAFSIRSMRDARPRGAFAERFRAMLSRFALDRVVSGDDRAVRAAGGLLLSAMEGLEAANPGACARIGARADLVLANAALSGDAARRRAIPELLAAIGVTAGGTRSRAWLLDAGDEAAWRPVSGVGSDCRAAIDAYRTAMAAGDGDAGPLRAMLEDALGKPVTGP